jgi:hypothetical protein
MKGSKIYEKIFFVVNIATDELFLRLFWKISPFDEITVLKDAT